MKDKKVLIIGKTPPPIGGVTIHVSRLLKQLEKIEFIHTFSNSSGSMFSVFKNVLSHKVIHLHTSNPYIRLIFSIICRCFQKKLILTYHGNLGRYRHFKNWVDYLSVYISNYPITININSYKKALKINKKALLISAFIPPQIPEPLSEDILFEIKNWKKGLEYIFCTNAFDLAYDKNNDEIYGVTQLLYLFKKVPKKGLIFSDPSGNYQRHWKNNSIQIPTNVLVISKSHSFFEILKHSQCYIRATTTDGDPLSIKEAFYLKKQVIASDCVERPVDCLTFKTGDYNDLYNKIIKFSEQDNSDKKDYNEVYKLFNLYSKILDNK